MDRERTINGEAVEQAPAAGDVEAVAADETPGPQAGGAGRVGEGPREMLASAGQDAGPIRPEEVETLRAEVTRLSEEAERNWQQFLRAAADLENYRKHAARQREEAVATTRRALLRVVLGVVDTLERAMEHAGQGAAEANSAAILDGIRLAHRDVLETLRGMDVRPIEAVGRPFDPRVHEAVEVVAPDEQTPAGTVVGEVQRGYLIGDDVLRPARVRVAQ
ncbi:MAG: nucleotide exchange factor GrpE [Armatimonadota bacterium]|nr:nucleotide exchange factor GrpE [Armatimonadota bacterium]MDR7536846.1 nucleotide exchange factor GrpE [Armatimonadota bacterium]